MSQQIQ
jgi:hypothetical protein